MNRMRLTDVVILFTLLVTIYVCVMRVSCVVAQTKEPFYRFYDSIQDVPNIQTVKNDSGSVFINPTDPTSILKTYEKAIQYYKTATNNVNRVLRSNSVQTSLQTLRQNILNLRNKSGYQQLFEKGKQLFLSVKEKNIDSINKIMDLINELSNEARNLSFEESDLLHLKETLDEALILLKADIELKTSVIGLHDSIVNAL